MHGVGKKLHDLGQGTLNLVLILKMGGGVLALPVS